MCEYNKLYSFDVIIVGAGFSGLYMLHLLRKNGFDAHIIETSEEIGGTWYWNCYPGARCDNESVDYSYSFDDELQQEWCWSERYASQAEILRYINHVADRFNLRKHISLCSRVATAYFDEPHEEWNLQTENRAFFRARYLVLATGCLSLPQIPNFPQFNAYQGRIIHTARWPQQEVDFTAQNIGVIGTGSSAIQLIPIVAGKAKSLTVFQRTPNFSVPARNKPMSPNDDKFIKATYAERRRQARRSRVGWVFESNDVSALKVGREDREREYENRWQDGGVNFLNSFNDLLTNLRSNHTATKFIRSKIQHIVQNQMTAELLKPHDHPIGTKRICCDNGYYETFNRDNVSLIDIRADPIASFTPSGIKTISGRYWAFDLIILATGFDAISGAISAIDIRGRGGCKLRTLWRDGPSTYLGLATFGFPNMFYITGPGSPSVLSNMIVSIEQHVEWIAACLAFLRETKQTTIEAEPYAENEWMQTVEEAADKTLFPLANSWYVGSNICGKPRRFLPFAGGVDTYADICKNVALNGYRGFRMKSN